MAHRPGYDWIDPADYWDENVGWNKFVDAVMSQRYRGRLVARRVEPQPPPDGWLGEANENETRGFASSRYA